MRLWSLHPKHLDARGLVALWREGLLAQAVLAGKTRGYKNHPQLDRFKKHRDPRAAIASYLGRVVDEADARGYRFARKKVGRKRTSVRIPVNKGQLAYEAVHLRRKLKKRSPADLKRLSGLKPHPLFRVRAGGVEGWEVR